MILKRLIEEGLKNGHDRQVTDVRIGLSYTAVALDDGSTGVAMTFRNDIPSGCLEPGTVFAGRPVVDLIQDADSDNLIYRTVGIAAANAVLNRPQDALIGGDTLALLDLTRDDVVGMVGYFGPFVPKLTGTVKKLVIFEKKPVASGLVFPETEMKKMLPDCSVAIITSTSLINRTFEGIVKSAESCRLKIMVGGSTPLSAEVFENPGIDWLSGIVVKDSPGMLRTISESGGTRSFRPYVDKVNLFCQKKS